MTAWSRIYIDMQITNSIAFDRVNVGLYNQIKPPLVGELLFHRWGLFASRLTLHLVAVVG